MTGLDKPQVQFRLVKHVDYWKVGKLNHNKAVESLVDWHQFRLDVESLFNQLGITKKLYYSKADLRKA